MSTHRGTPTRTTATPRKTSGAKKATPTSEQKLRRMLRGDDWPHPSFLTGSAATSRPISKAELTVEQARKAAAGYRDDADTAMPGERELTQAQKKPTADEVAEIVEYEQTLAGGTNA